MKDGGWLEAFSELVDSATAAIARLWKQLVVSVGLYLGFLLALGLPVILVILHLWWVDLTGWRPAKGFYKIGEAPARMQGPAGPSQVGARVTRHPLG